MLADMGAVMFLGLLTSTVPELTQEDHIRINFQALLISIAFVGSIIIAVVVINRIAGKRRYEAHQAKLAAEGRTERSNALAEIANSPSTKFVNDDEPATPEERKIGSVFGDNYRPYGEDGIGAGGV